MKRFALLLLAATGMVGRAGATTPVEIGPSLLTTSVDGDVTVDPTGAIQSYRVTTDVPDGMAAKLDAMVRNVRLAPPAMGDGRGPVHARMRITLAGLPQDDGSLDTRLENVWFTDGANKRGNGELIRDGVHMTLTGRRASPVYPDRGARSNTDATVLVMLRFGLDGRVADAAVRQSALYVTGGDPAAIAVVLGDFETSALKALRKWRVKVDVDPGARPTDEQLSALVPVEFTMWGHVAPKPGEWRWEVRSQKREAPWLQHRPDMPLAGVSDIDARTVMAGVQSPLRLAVPIQDQAL